MTNARQSYEGMPAYDAGYRKGYREGYIRGHDDATSMSFWYWDKDGMDWGIGAWRCASCNTINYALPSESVINPFNWEGSNYCPQCGKKMVEKEELV